MELVRYSLNAIDMLPGSIVFENAIIFDKHVYLIVITEAIHSLRNCWSLKLPLLLLRFSIASYQRVDAHDIRPRKPSSLHGWLSWLEPRSKDATVIEWNYFLRYLKLTGVICINVFLVILSILLLILLNVSWNNGPDLLNVVVARNFLVLIHILVQHVDIRYELGGLRVLVIVKRELLMLILEDLVR